MKEGIRLGERSDGHSWLGKDCLSRKMGLFG